jgi:hypothetical protein
MRLLAAAGFLALAGASGACAALDGLTDYQECTSGCVGTKVDSNDSSTLEMPMDSGGPAEESATPTSDDSTPPDDEAGGAVDANLNDVSPALDSGMDAPSPPDEASVMMGGDAGQDAGPPPPTGTSCGPRGTTTHCSGSQVCCATLTSQTNACASTCASNATLMCSTTSDCPASKPICCGQATFAVDSMIDPPPKCAVAAFTASCASTCNDAPPTSCTFAGTLRLCSHDTDCASDSNALAGTQCWNFNNAPESWCTSATVGGLGGGIHQP